MRLGCEDRVVVESSTAGAQMWPNVVHEIIVYDAGWQSTFYFGTGAVSGTKAWRWEGLAKSVPRIGTADDPCTRPDRIFLSNSAALQLQPQRRESAASGQWPFQLLRTATFVPGSQDPLCYCSPSCGLQLPSPTACSHIPFPPLPPLPMNGNLSEIRKRILVV